ncbi:SDR family oxidoreductase [uncultured Roseibium sp.]|uniref:SDR family oxidoreductase n=1 Tax=uncultured Roseibium sp. TaxID=1936171 RepID=UPI003216812C
MENAPIAVITGGSSRIGRAMAEDLASHGWSLVLHAHSHPEKADELVRDIRSRGGRAEVLIADLTDIAELRGFMADAAKPFGNPSVLINNASIFEDDIIGELDPARYDAHFNIHTRAPVFLAEDFAKRLPEGRNGLIVNVIDQRVWKLTPQAFSYTLSKAALWTATRTLAQALAPRIRVNAIGPGPSFRNIRQSEEEFDKQWRSVPLGKGPSPADFGRTVRFLWESGSLTGQMIAIDGGQHLAWETGDVIGVGE